MTDNDSLSNKIPGRWSKPYAQLVQWKLGLSFIARRHLVALKKDVQAYGNSPIYLLQDQASHFRNTMAKFLSGNINPIDEFERIGMSSNVYGEDKRGMNLARKVSEKYFIGLLDYSTVSALNDHHYLMTRNYIESIYESEYTANVMRHTEVSKDLVDSRLREIKPLMDRGMDYFAEQLVQLPNVSKLRLPRGIAAPKLKSAGEIDSFLQESIRIS